MRNSSPPKVNNRLAWALSALAPIIVALSCPAGAAERVYVQARGEIHVFDAHNFKPVAKIVIGDPTDDVIGAPDGSRVFANSWLSSGNPLGFTEAGRVIGINTRTNEIAWSTFVDGTPHHMTVSKDGKRLFVPLLDQHYLVVLDTETGKIIDRWYGVIGGHGTERSPDGRRLYVGNVLMDQIYVYDTSNGAIVRTYSTSDGVRPFKIDEKEKRIYYQLSKLNGFEVRDLETGTIVERVNLPKLKNQPKEDVFPHTYNHGMALTPDGKRILVAATLDNYIGVYTLQDLKLVGTIAVGHDANWIRVRRDGKIAFVGVRGGNYVAAIDLDTLTEIKRIPAGEHPGRLDIVEVPDE